MSPKHPRRVAGVSALLAAQALLLAASAQAAENEKVFGLAAGNLVTFQTATPGTATATAALTGFGAGETAVGIDVQPATGRLFAVTKGAGNSGRVYVVNKATGAATLVTGTPFDLGAGTAYDIDFNPVPNAIRIVSDAELNLRVSPVNGNLVAADTALTPAGAVSGAAYTNNVSGAQQTTLYDIDTGDDTLRRQGGPGGTPSPNAGVLTSVGALGVDTEAAVAGFDVSGTTSTAYAVLDPVAPVLGANPGPGLYSVDLRTGAATLVGTTAAGVTDLAVDLQPPSVQFAVANFGATERGGKATVTISRSGNLDGASTVSYATAATGTASAADFTAVAATPVTFAPGEASKTFDIALTDDAAAEGPETIAVALSANTGAALGLAAATVTVFDDDAAVSGAGGGTGGTAGEKLKPILFVKALSSARYKTLVSGFSVKASSSEASTIAYTLKSGSVTVGRVSVKLNAAAIVTTRVKLTKAGRTRVGRLVPTGPRNSRKRARLTLTAVATDLAGNKSRSSTTRISVRR